MVRSMLTATAGVNVGGSWSDQGTSIRLDVISLVMALALHAPLFFMKFDSHKKDVTESKTRLVSVDLVDEEALKPKEVAPPPPPPPAAKESGLMSKLKALVKKEPPPPPPEKKLEEKIAEMPKPLPLQAKLDMPEKLAPKLESKAGFKTTADPKLVEDKKLAMQGGVVGIAPLSASKLGTVADRSTLKSSKAGFQVAKNESISSIDGGGPALAGAGAAPTISIHTGTKGSTEKFSAPAPQKSDKGRIGGIPSAGLASGPNLGLRDSIIARDASPTQIASSGGVPGGVAGGVPGGTGTKRDAGRFQGGAGGVIGGVEGGVAGGTVGGVSGARKISETPVRRKEKSMFTITGPLKDRRIEKQVIPEYPAWAQAQGIEAAVVLEFTVDANGFVKNNVVVRRTSGYPKLDDTAIKALRQWKFVPLGGDENREEVGMITFNYALN